MASITPLVAIVSVTLLVNYSGQASWYGENHRGKPMANGKPFNPKKLTCASWIHKMGTRLEVTTCWGGEHRSVIVEVTDRGPARRLLKKGIGIDLSEEAFFKLGPPLWSREQVLALGIMSVEVRELP